MIGYSKFDQVGKSKKKPKKEAKPEQEDDVEVGVEFAAQIKPGKKTLAWNAQRQALKTRFESVGITTCELKLGGICMDDFALSFAHEKKRGDLLPGELVRVALSCSACHEYIERQIHKDQMYDIVHSVIEGRTPAINKVLLAP